jgi:hypothetical protein
VIAGGWHSTNARPDEIARERGAVLHFKFLGRFVDRLEDELRDRRSDAGDSSESYGTYEQALISDPDLCLYDPKLSIRLRNSRQLVELGIMRDGAAVSEGDGESAPMATVDDYVARMHKLVPGWFEDIDAAVFRAIDQADRAAGVDGDLLEIGAFLGKSAILLGYLVRPSERLVVCDLFANDDLHVDLDADAAHYGELSRAAFESNYARFHRRAASVIQRSSTELAEEGLGRSFRLVHVDGSHRYEIVRQDIDTALDLVVDGGIVVVDDYRTVPHALGVAAAVWEAVTDGKLIPLLATVQKLYACAPGSAESNATRMLRRWALDEAPFDGLLQEVAGYEMVVFAPPMGSATLAAAEPRGDDEQLLRPADEEVAQLEERLRLIEGSRTWRLRNRLMRLIRRDRTRRRAAPG